MTEKQQIIDELRSILDGDPWHAASLAETLQGITAEQAAQKLGASHSIWEIGGHIAGWNNVWAERLRGNAVDSPPNGNFPERKQIADAAWDELKTQISDSFENLTRAIDGRSDSELNERFGTNDYTLSFFLHGTVRHNVHHAAQIALLKSAIPARESVAA
ncbi:MAG: DinB superfamily protein [Acidobacteria bacterium OLB17]|nr:MAG: DinB superfamily protein [Acidobacteria bacterium OLB17]MCZ2390964.1 DinB family protein [Acidobacteriota bacterium]